MKHIYKLGENTDGPTLLLLHGTGGTEHDLLPLANRVDSNANILSVKGNVSENGMARFFRRLSEGVFDEDDLIFRTKELNAFLDQASHDYAFDRDKVIAVGYSNGANIAASLLFHYKNALKGAILHHPMVPRRNIDLPNLSGKQIFIAAGTNDPMCPAQESKDLSTFLENAQADVTVHWENFGHQLTNSEVEAAAKWYQNQEL